jgi:hypothetical protein
MTTTAASTEARFHNLRIWNIAMGALHAVQAVLVLVLANDFALPVTATFLTDAPGVNPPELTRLFEIRIAWGVAAFLFLSAAAHWIVASPGVFPWYRKNLLRDRNYARWIEYALSSSIMVVLIALLPGIADVAALGAIFGVNAAMILFGLLVEHYESPGRPNWLSYWFGVVTGAVPWVIIGLYIFSPGSASGPPTFVYAIFISLFIFFNTFAVNMVLQYRRVGRWADYLFGEKVYIVLSLTAKSILAWQVFGGTLAG